jgi:TM2 domain-containing membrane protein YozV
MTPDQARIELMSLASKSTGTAYLLWVFGGIGGYHRFYLGLVNSAVAMLVTLWLSAITLIILVGFVGLFALFVWWVVDAFLISGWVSERNNRIATLMTAVTQKPHEPLPG